MTVNKITTRKYFGLYTPLYLVIFGKSAVLIYALKQEGGAVFLQQTVL